MNQKLYERLLTTPPAKRPPPPAPAPPRFALVDLVEALERSTPYGGRLMEKTWCDWIVQAMQHLGGTAAYEDLHRRIRLIRSDPFTPEWKATVRRTIETHSSDSENFQQGSPDIYSV